jgi:hypothetical protein
MGVSTANDRSDIDPSKYDFERRGFVGAGNSTAPRSRDLARLESAYPDVSHSEIQAFMASHARVMSFRISRAMSDAHGPDWFERAHDTRGSL